MTNNFSAVVVIPMTHHIFMSFLSQVLILEWIFFKNDEMNPTISKSLLLLCSEPMRTSNYC